MAARRDDYAPGFNPWLIRLPILAFSGMITLMLLLVLLVAVAQLRFRDRIMPGVSSFGVDLTGMTRPEAQAALEAQFTYGAATVFTFRDGARFWQATASDLGLSLDAASTLDAAFNTGRGQGVIFNLAEQGLAWLNGQPIDPLLRYDQAAAAAFLSAIAAEIDRPPQDAALTIANGQVATTPATNGRTLDVRATLTRLDGALISLSPGGEIALAITETPPIAFDAEAAAQKARIAMSAPLLLVAEAPDGTPIGPWQARADQIAALLRVVTVNDGRGGFRYDVTADMEPFRAYLDGLAQGLIGSPQNARFQFDETTGTLIPTLGSISGRTLNVDETLRRMSEAAFNPNDRTVPLAFNYSLPAYPDTITAAELGIRELIATGRTTFAGSTQARKDNIAVSAARFDGLIIAPGQTFSFNSYLGDISPEEGYVASKVIIGGRTVDGVGGGVCQVSTTMFQAAFYAGFPIVERYPHGYRVGYYERGEGVGLDAAIYKPDETDSPYAQELDMRFVNDTAYHVLIEMSYIPTSDELEFRFYSTNTGRQIVKLGPEVINETPSAPTRYEANVDFSLGEELQVDYAARGAEVRVTRLILDAAGAELRRDLIYSNYQPWGAVVQVAPGDPRLAG